MPDDAPAERRDEAAKKSFDDLVRENPDSFDSFNPREKPWVGSEAYDAATLPPHVLAVLKAQAVKPSEDDPA